MGRKLRVSILYNEPTVAGISGRKYITENGKIQEEPPTTLSRKDLARERAIAKTANVDLSEIGVLEEMEDIKEALVSLGYRTAIMNVDADIYRLIDYLRAEKPDIVFNLVECVENESLQEMHVAGLYELLKIPYTGAGPFALGVALNKPRVKELLSYHGIPTPRFQVFQPTARIALAEEMEFPLIVKPSHEDGSVGISNSSVVSTMGELRRLIRYIFEEFEQPALVEQYIDGRELNVAILGHKIPQALPISEIDFSGLTNEMPKIVTYKAKWMHGTIEYEGTKGLCPARLTTQQEARLKEIALKCFHIVGCRDYARVDFRMAPNGQLYVLEVNPNPDISDEAGFARSAKAAGYTFPEVIGKIVESALERYRTPS
jgi:D-alanine-D-alanine ligase